jgi:hypothetical protein
MENRPEGRGDRRKVKSRQRFDYNEESSLI